MTENSFICTTSSSNRMKGDGGYERSNSSTVRTIRRGEMDQQNKEHQISNRDNFDMVKMKGVKSALLKPNTTIGRAATSTPIKCPSPSFADMNRDESIKQEEVYYNNRSWKLYNRITNYRNKKRRSSVPAQKRRRSSTASSLSYLPNMQYESTRRSSIASTTSVEKGVFNLEF